MRRFYTLALQPNLWGGRDPVSGLAVRNALPVMSNATSSRWRCRCVKPADALSSLLDVHTVRDPRLPRASPV